MTKPCARLTEERRRKVGAKYLLTADNLIG
jgi:hypothetical protein